MDNINIKPILENFGNKPDVVTVLLYLLLNADEQGDCSISVLGLSHITNIDYNRIKRIIGMLIRLQVVTNKPTNKPTNKSTNVSFCNIGDYVSKTQTNRLTKQLTNRLTKKRSEEENKPSKPVLSPLQGDIVIEDESFVGRMQRDYPHVMKLENPLQEKEYEKLVAQYGRSSVDEVLMAMDNRKTLLKDYTSAYSTALQWLKKRNPDSSGGVTWSEQNNHLLGQYPKEHGSYGAFLLYISQHFMNVWRELPAPTEEDFSQIMADTSKRGYLAEVLKRMDGDKKNRQCDNFYAAFINILENKILRYESTNTKLKREQAERHDALKQQQAESLRRGAESQEPLFGNY